MNTVYFMNNAPDYSKLMVFGDANLTDIWCKKMQGTLEITSYPGDNGGTSGRPPCNPSYTIHLPYGSTCTCDGLVTRSTYANHTGTNGDWEYMNAWHNMDTTKYFPDYSNTDDTTKSVYGDRNIIFNYCYDF
jgi:hypothetical protein